MAFANGNGFIVEVLALGQTGRAGIVWRDAWGGATAYVANDGVFYLGSSYRCVVANINVVPTNAAFWAPPASPAQHRQDCLQSDRQWPYNATVCRLRPYPIPLHQYSADPRSGAVPDGCLSQTSATFGHQSRPVLPSGMTTTSNGRTRGRSRWRQDAAGPAGLRSFRNAQILLFWCWSAVLESLP